MMWTLTPTFLTCNEQYNVRKGKLNAPCFHTKRWLTFSGESLNTWGLAVNQLVTHAQPVSRTYRDNSAINNWYTIHQYLEPSVLLCIAELAISQYINILFQHYLLPLYNKKNCMQNCLIIAWYIQLTILGGYY